MDQYSVLMTIYKKDNPIFARKSIDSMLNQSIKTDDFVIVCDGALTDELNNMINEYKINYPNLFHVIRLKENKGLGAALRIGVIKCKNELVARMDNDDISEINRCEKELKLFERKPYLSIVGSYMYEFENEPMFPVRIKKVPVNQSEIINLSKRRNPFNHSTVMFKKNDIISVGNYKAMRTNQDVELWIRCLNKGLLTENIPEPLVSFRFDSNTYKRRKNWKNVKLMIDIWHSFKNKKYCSKKDYYYVLLMQLAIFIMPIRLMQWIYDNLR